MKLLLVDGHALAYRSYFAMIRNPLTNRRGENTSAEYGFVRTLLATLREQSPDALLVCFDPLGKSFRHERYPAYKAQRAKTPEELHESVERIQAFLQAAGYAWLRREGYEADDLMASAARQAASGGWRVILLTGDKDLCQLVDEQVQVLRPALGKKPARELDSAAVREEFGVQPEHLLDYLSLVGDSSDNLPGVAGLGPKTAQKLLGSFPDLAAIYAALDQVRPAGLRAKLEQGREDAFLTRDLIRLVTDLDLEQGPENWRLGPPAETATLRDWLIDRGFNSLLREFETGGDKEEAGDYTLVRDEAALAALVEELRGAERFAVDTETTGLDAMQVDLVGISFSTEAGRACYVPVAGLCAGGALELATIRKALAPVLADPTHEKVAQNLKYDAQVLERQGLPLAEPCYDTMLASYCVDPSRRSHSLDSLALELLGHEMLPYEALFEQGDKERDIRQVPLDKLAHYAAEDADYTLRLAEVLDTKLADAGVAKLFRELEMPLVPVLRSMEEAGIALDVEHLAALSSRMEGERLALAERIFAEAGREFTIGSPKQLAAVLFDELGLPTGKKTKTGYSTDEEVLSELAAEHDIAGWVLEWRELSKLKNTYVDVLPAMVKPATGRVHTRFNQAVTATGRLSSSDPNLQNIPIRSELGREIRRAFIAPPGSVLASFDYSQVELRLLAHISGDKALRDAFAAGRDIHRWTAARITGKDETEVTRDERNRSKMVNYGVVYGMGARGLAARLRISRQEAQSFIDEYFECFPGIRGWIDELLERVRREGAVTTLFGRRRALPEINSGNGRIRSFAERVAVNTPIQGTAADLIKRAMIDLHARLVEESWGARMLLQVHDELLFEVPEAELAVLSEAVVKIMEGVADIAVPLEVQWGAGANWLEAH